jgi:hypothetical protein
LESPIQIDLGNSQETEKIENSSEDVLEYKRVRNYNYSESWMEILFIASIILGIFMCYTNISGGVTSIDRRDLM